MNEEKRLAYKVSREAEAAADLLASLRGDNETVQHDMVEGETGLLEALEAAIVEMDDAEAIVAGCKDRIGVLADRKAQAERRIERVRGLIEQALHRVELPSIRLPLATLTVKETAPKPIYEDEAQIPARFWKTGNPTLDRAAVKSAIEAGETVPGVSMSNGGISLQIRRK